MSSSISASLIARLKIFGDVRTAITHHIATNVDETDLNLWDDELGRLPLWAGNIGAHQTGQSGLEYRLRDASHIKQRINKLLQDFYGILEEVEEYLSEKGEPEQSSGSDTLSDDDDSETELQQLHKSLNINIDGLFKMSILVRRPAPHNLLMDPTPPEIAAYLPYDRNHVRDKFPKAEDFLVQRLGQAITQRRKHLRYRERHSSKLRAGLDVAEGKVRENAPTLYSNTIVTDNSTPVIDLGDRSSDSGLSQTSYAQTLMTGGDIKMPPPPKESRGGAPFQCPYCFLLIAVPSSRLWYKHLFQDLMPYSCTVSTCSVPHRLYATRREWIRHLRSCYHSDESASFSDAEDERLEGLSNCPLCRDVRDRDKISERHIARHLQELALFVLPSSHEDGEESEYASEFAAKSTQLKPLIRRLQARRALRKVAAKELLAARVIGDNQMQASSVAPVDPVEALSANKEAASTNPRRRHTN